MALLSLSAASLAEQAPQLPDVDLAIAEIEARVHPEPSGFDLIAIKATESGLLNKNYLDDMAKWLGAGSRRALTLWQVRSGVADLRNLADRLNALTCHGDICSLAAPLVIGPGAGLLIQGKADNTIELRLNRNGGAMLANSGELWIDNARIVGWDGDGPALDPGVFRPFIVSTEGSVTVVRHTQLAHLGYDGAHAYGFNLTKLERGDGKSVPAPTGDLLYNRIDGLFYAFYSHGAEDVRILGNVIRDSHKYGIDPHDDSRRLLIARNDVANTEVVKSEFGPPGGHGIIISRRVTDSWILQNRSIDNARSGIVIDKASDRNVVSNNIARGNGDDGITVFESDDLWIFGNQLEENGDSGIRVRSSKSVRVQDNVIGKHPGYCVKVTGRRGGRRTTELSLARNACDTGTRLLRLEDMEQLTLGSPAFMGNPAGKIPRARVNGPEPWRTRTLDALSTGSSSVIGTPP